MRQRLYLHNLIAFGRVCLALTGYTTPLHAQPTPQKPNIRARAAIVMDAKTGAVLFAKNPDKSLPPASTTKIMTGYLFARDVKPEQKVPTPLQATQIAGSVLGMSVGETFTARDLLYAAMLQSANDACIAMAQHQKGSVSAFVAQMNSEAQALGLTNTRFVNPNGLPASGHVSTARDLANLSRVALKNPEFAQAVRTKTYVIPASQSRPAVTLTNRNELLWTVPGMIGVKTGQSGEAGMCLVGAAIRNGRQIITVVLNSPRWKEDTVALVKFGFAARGGISGPARVESTNGQQPTPGNINTQQTPVQGNVRTGTPASTPETGPSASLPTSESVRPGNTGVQPRTGTSDSLPKTSNGTVLEPGTPPSPASDNSAANKDTPESKTIYQGSGAFTRDPNPTNRMQAQPRQAAWQTSRRTIPPYQPKHFPFPWKMLLWLLLIPAGYLLNTLMQRGLTAMNPGFVWPFGAKKKKETPTVSQELAESFTGSRRSNKGSVQESAEPPFVFMPPVLERLPGQDWLNQLIENSSRLLEPAIRRRARACISANNNLNLDKVFQMLGAQKPRTRLTGAELLMDVAPRRAEETLVSLIEEEKTPGDVRAEAMDLLSENTSDRHEPFFLRMMLRDGSPTAANALARLPRLDATTSGALRHVVSTPREPNAELRAHMLSAQSACVLGAQELLPPEEIMPLLERLPMHHREQAQVNVLKGVTCPWAIERMVKVAMRGQAYAAMQNLLECPPEQVHTALDALPQSDATTRTRQMVLRWLLLGEGEAIQLKKLAEAGDDVANGALNLARLYRWDPLTATPDALLAAAMLTSLRLGFTNHPPEQITGVFRTVGDDGRNAQTIAEELEPLRQAYAHPEVYDAVQAAVNTEAGMEALVTALAHSPQNQSYQTEMAFWSDKLPDAPRLMLTQALAQSDQETSVASLSARASDPNPLIRATALRSSYTRMRDTAASTPPVVAIETEPEPEITLDKAA